MYPLILFVLSFLVDFFLRTLKAYIDCRKETITLRFGEDEVLFHFSKFKNQPYHKELNDEEGKTIAELAAIYYGTPYEEEEDYEDYEDTDDERSEERRVGKECRL